MVEWWAEAHPTYRYPSLGANVPKAPNHTASVSRTGIVIVIGQSPNRMQAVGQKHKGVAVQGQGFLSDAIRGPIVAHRRLPGAGG